ncbi:S-adenosylmethionine decarboxylase [Candidatus Bathyarchaeota archaeon]|nr:S-adenosylmethionine decarboxylase [Candidatus Bathyarchaeota archaeon]
MIGLHLIIDGVVSNRVEEKDLEKVLSELPAIIDMRTLAGPLTVRGLPENPGVTGFVIVDKSHIAIHTFDEGNKISIDVFSCKTFKEREVIEYLKDRLKIVSFHSKLLKRG